jgi:hypothetical protein
MRRQARSIWWGGWNCHPRSRRTRKPEEPPTTPSAAVGGEPLPDAKPKRRRFVPSDEELARFLDYDLPENLWRWVLVQLTTAGRPQTAIDLSPEMRNRQTGVIDLNPPGRKQNKKYRATVREPKVLSGWLNRWEREAREQQSDGILRTIGVTAVIDLLKVRSRDRENSGRTGGQSSAVIGIQLSSYRHYGASPF